MNALLLRVSVVCFAFLLGCSDSVQHLTKTSIVPTAESIVNTMLEDLDGQVLSGLSSKNLLPGFYQTRHNNLTWIRNGELLPQGDSLISILNKAPYYGLIRDDYHAWQIDSLMGLLNKENVMAAAHLDILLSDAYLTMGHHLHLGRLDQNDYTHKVVSNIMDSTVIRVLMEGVQKNRIQEGLASLEPKMISYHSLKNLLAIKLDSIALHPNDSIKQILEAQSIMLTINLEKWRWERGEDQRSIFVNIPSYKLQVRHHDSLLFESNVVVGTPETPTPKLDADIRSFIVYPYWNVPRQIAVEEILPKVKRDSLYLQRNHFQVVDVRGNLINPDSVKWSKYHVNNFPFMFQQTEGEHNALGIIKFPFYSEKNIYLHDTNTKRTFARSKRAYSHGCVRVERAIELAKFLVSEKNRYCNPKDLDQFISAREQKLITVNKINLHIRYFTCEVRSDGNVEFLDDVYQLDQELKSALYCRND